jgi:acetyltransferase-like isoleucine patch superfamily enzyme
MNPPTTKHVQIRDVQFGKEVVVIEPVNLYECTIGDHCFIGPFVEIQRNAIIGHHTKVQSHAFICELVTIGNHCFISHGVKFINDMFTGGGPAGGDKTKWRATTIGNYVSIGTNATVLPVRIVDHVVVGAGSLVNKPLLKPGIYAGNPIHKIRDIKIEA